jgi:hypothetical protein
MMQSVARLVGAVAMLLLPVGASAGEEETITAFVPWVGQGATFRTGTKDLTFVGSLVGPVYVESDKGPIPSGRMTCPAMVKINENAEQEATGRCVVKAKEGALLFAEISCKGVFLIGCEGEFTITGGTDRFAGVTGSGPVLVRSEQRTIAVMQDAVAQDQGTGILYLRGLHYKLP